MTLKPKELSFWKEYEGQHPHLQELTPHVEASIVGDLAIADQLLGLILAGKKTATSSLVKEYELAQQKLPEVGQFWIVLDKMQNPGCIVETLRVESHRFDEVGEEIAIAEGEGDLSVSYWRQEHERFFRPVLTAHNIEDLNSQLIVTEFFKVVHK